MGQQENRIWLQKIDVRNVIVNVIVMKSYMLMFMVYVLVLNVYVKTQRMMARNVYRVNRGV